MAVITSDPFLVGDKSFVIKTDGDTATIVRIATGKNISQTEKESAGDYYNSNLNEIEYAKIYNLNFGADWIDKLGASDEWMAEVQTNPTFKNIFKKSAGKTGPNISFASAIEANKNWDLTSINSDANGNTTYNPGSGTLYYPLNRDREKTDYLQVSAVKYIPNSFGVATREGKKVFAGGLTEDADDRMNEKRIGSVFLPMQGGLADSSSVSWNEDKLDPLAAMGAKIAGNTIAGAGDGMVDAAKGLIDSSGDAARKVFAGVDENVVSTFFAGKAIGNDKLLTRGTGKVLNPNLELLFSGPTLRTFAYSYKFTPREDKEAKMIRSIIRFFKKNMAVQRDESGALFLKSPNVFRLKYIFKGRDQHPFLNKIKLCALTSCNVQYTPDGNYATYDDGSMTSYGMSLSFGELNPIYDKDYDGPENDMGY